MEKSTIRGHQVVCSAFIEKDNKFLIVFCPKFKVWRVLGGRAEWGEKLEETLLREMEEETGVKFKNPIFLGWGQDQQTHIQANLRTSRLIMYFHLKTDQKLNLDPDEVEEHKWLTLEEIKQMDNKEQALNEFFERNPNIHLS